MKQWTDQQYRRFVESHCEVDYSTGEATMSLEFLRELAFDPRTPDNRAEMLQATLRHYEAGTLPDLYSRIPTRPHLPQGKPDS